MKFIRWKIKNYLWWFHKINWTCRICFWRKNWDL